MSPHALFVATTSILAAVLAKADALLAANFPGGVRPAFYFDEVPATDAAGVPIYPPYCVVKDTGQDVIVLGFEHQTQEVAGFVVEVYYPLLGDVDVAVLAIKRNGGTTLQALGLDFGTLSDLVSPRGTFTIVRVREERAKAGDGKTAARVHVCRITYRVEILEGA